MSCACAICGYHAVMGNAEPGWYESDGRRRWWDGESWTDRYLDDEQPAPPPPPDPAARYDPAMDAKAAPDLHPKKSRLLPFTCGGCIVVIIVVFALGAFANANRKPYSPNNRYEAIAQCEDVVSGQLKSPSSAQFESDASSSGSGTWKVTGTVDAQNSFGATIRATFGCTVQVTGETITRKLDYFR